MTVIGTTNPEIQELPMISSECTEPHCSEDFIVEAKVHPTPENLEEFMESQNLVFNEVDEFEDGVMESQHGTKTMEQLIGDAINVSIPIIDVSTYSKVERNQKNLQSKHKDYFVDFIGVEQFNVILNFFS